MVELSFRRPLQPSPSHSEKQISSILRSIFVGWTGMQSKGKPAPVVGRDGLAGSRGNTVANVQNLPTVEVDATFAQVVGLTEGMKVYDLICPFMNFGD